MLKKKSIYRQEGRYKRPKWQFPERKRKDLLWGLGKDPKRDTCVSEEQDQEGQLSRDTAKMIRRKTEPELAGC